MTFAYQSHAVQMSTSVNIIQQEYRDVREHVSPPESNPNPASQLLLV